MVYYYLFLFFGLIHCAVIKCPTTPSPCNQPTNIFLQYKAGNFSKSSIFLENTFLPTYGFDPCTKYGSRTDYIDDLAKYNILCSGRKNIYLNGIYLNQILYKFI